MGNKLIGLHPLILKHKKFDHLCATRSKAGPPNIVAIGLGDFNADGFVDMAVVNEASPGAVSLLLGNGDGTFQPAQTFPFGAAPNSLVVADFNADGKLDLAVGDSNGVNILLGNGDGSFQPGQTYAVGPSIHGLVIGDFNGDGNLDIVTTWGGMLLGNGDGTFQALPKSYVPGYNPQSLVTGDFNQDGKLDIAVADYEGVSILLGNGDGTFLHCPVSYRVGPSPSAVAVADFNGDGILDPAVANGGFPDPGNTVSVLLGQSQGVFQPAQNYGVGSRPSALAVGDLNGDGFPDLVVADQDSNTISVLLGKGDGSFQGGQDYPVGKGPTAVAVGDFNRDGSLDIVTNTGSILLGNGDGTFQPAMPYGPNGSALAVGDFNGDGVLDIALCHPGVYGSYNATVEILAGNGDGTFRSLGMFLDGYGPTSITVADVNGDGILDLLTTNYYVEHAGHVTLVPEHCVLVLMGNGDGTFQPALVNQLEDQPVSLAVADFNGDGQVDMAVVAYGFLLIWLGNGDGTFQDPQFFAAGESLGFQAVGDFNGDGLPDLAVANPADGTVTVLLNDGNWPP